MPHCGQWAERQYTLYLSRVTTSAGGLLEACDNGEQCHFTALIHFLAQMANFGAVTRASHESTFFRLTVDHKDHLNHNTIRHKYHRGYSDGIYQSEDDIAHRT